MKCAHSAADVHVPQAAFGVATKRCTYWSTATPSALHFVSAVAMIEMIRTTSHDESEDKERKGKKRMRKVIRPMIAHIAAQFVERSSGNSLFVHAWQLYVATVCAPQGNVASNKDRF